MPSQKLEYQSDENDQESATERIALRTVINDNSNLFLVMGVFAALSVYISRVPSDQVNEENIQLGLVSSLLITGLIGVIILYNLRNQVSEESSIMENLFHLKNLDTVSFISLFLALYFSLYKVITEETRSLAVISTILIPAAIITLFVTLIESINERLAHYISYPPFRTGIAGGIVSIFNHGVMRWSMGFIEENYQPVPFNQMQETTFTDTLPTILYLIFSIGTQISPIFVGMFATLTVISGIDILREQHS